MNRTLGVLMSLGLVGWGTLVVGKKRGWIGKDDVIDYCNYILRKSHDEKAISMLVVDEASEKDFFDALNKSAGPFEEFVEQEKWRLAFLVCISNLNSDDSEKIRLLQEVYADFYYPEDMVECSIYGDGRGDPLAAMMRVIAELSKKLCIKNNITN